MNPDDAVLLSDLLEASRELVDRGGVGDQVAEEEFAQRIRAAFRSWIRNTGPHTAGDLAVIRKALEDYSRGRELQRRSRQ